jgi:cytochrome P450
MSSLDMAVTTVLLTAALVFAIVFFLHSPKSTIPRGAKEPAGPSPKPLLGNLLDIPPSHSWLKFFEWSKQFGPLYKLNLAGQDHVIVSTETIANDLLRERGQLYSSRPALPMAVELLSRNLRPVFLPYGSEWRNGRKLMHTLTNVSVATSYEPLQEEESIRAVRDLLREPAKYETWLERYSAGLILRLAYSKRVVTGKEPFVRRILAVVHNVERVASPGAYLVDTFPILMRLPTFLSPFKQEGNRLHKEEITLCRDLLAEGSQSAQDNFCTRWEANRSAYDISYNHVAYVIGTLFEAGAGTTAAAMMSFILAMTLHPKEHALLYDEIDSIVRSRLPNFSDIPRLPRVRAVAKEVLRWRPVTAGGLPHMLVKHDTYTLPNGDNVFLKAGTCVHPVQWSIHRGDQLYPDPDSFRPERWLDAQWPTFKEPLDRFPNLQNFSAFGFGRRICPGQNIAERSIYILIARITWAATIGAKKDAHGQDILSPTYDYVAGFNVSSVKLRHATHR